MRDLPPASRASFVNATAKRIFAEHKAEAMTFAQGRLDAALLAREGAEIEIWRSIVPALEKLARRQRY